MTRLPETKWIPGLLPNPNRKWWQFWKPKFIWNLDQPIVKMLFEHNKIMDDLPWVEIPKKELHND